jgi:hypothetical protein
MLAIYYLEAARKYMSVHIQMCIPGPLIFNVAFSYWVY